MKWRVKLAMCNYLPPDAEYAAVGLRRMLGSYQKEWFEVDAETEAGAVRAARAEAKKRFPGMTTYRRIDCCNETEFHTFAVSHL